MILTRAMQANALRALGIEQDGTIATVTITPTAVVIVHARPDGLSWTDVHPVASEVVS